MFTRDISLEDCILDLIDNSIDSVIRTRQINVSSTILIPITSGSTPRKKSALPTVTIEISPTKFRISDNCGGISRSLALSEVFTFGHGELPLGSQLGVYGIGLKRAMFKLGSNILVESRTKTEGFRADIDLDDWASPGKENDWTFPITFIDGTKKSDTAGTVIEITNLRPEVRAIIASGMLDKRLSDLVAKTYCLFLENHVRIEIDKTVVHPISIPLSRSENIKPAVEKLEKKVEGSRVTTTLLCGLATRDGNKTWSDEWAGWYVMCNGRIVVAADKTDLTGWGTGAMPMFHSKHRGFIGIAFFHSENPRLLPWTTTKRGLNRESSIYLEARNKMALVSRPILNFLNRMYPGDLTEEPTERSLVSQLRATDIRQIAIQQPKPFSVVTRDIPVKKTMRVQFDARKSDIEKIRKHLKRPSMSGAEVGQFTLDYYVKTECPE